MVRLYILKTFCFSTSVHTYSTPNSPGGGMNLKYVNTIVFKSFTVFDHSMPVNHEALSERKQNSPKLQCVVSVSAQWILKLWPPCIFGIIVTVTKRETNWTRQMRVDRPLKVSSLHPLSQSYHVPQVFTFICGHRNSGRWAQVADAGKPCISWEEFHGKGHLC